MKLEHATNARQPVAIVIPWFGVGLLGGAEQQAAQIAERLHARGHAVEVLTTCCRSFHDDWAMNFYPVGESVEPSGVRVRRFPVDGRDRARFDQVNARLLALDPADLRPGVSPLHEEDARVFVEHGINSAALLAHLATAHDRYQRFIFLPYMFGTTVRGLPLVEKARALLQPCLHDEAAAYLPCVEATFHGARRVLFNSEGEQQLAARLYGPAVWSRGTVIGEGIEPLPPPHDDAQVNDALPAAPFVLYLGRREPAKNVDLLVRAFTRYRAEHPRDELLLVLAGAGAASFHAPERGVFDLGVVTDDAKAALLRRCRALFQPSRHESFSRVMMEAWSVLRPVAAQRDCLATATAVERSHGGGWLASDEAEWAQLFRLVASSPDAQLDQAGARGHAYAATHADWDKVLARYEDELGLNTKFDPSPPAPEAVSAPLAPLPVSMRTPRAVHQLLPDFVPGDAISNQARSLRELLRAAGYASDIFVLRRADALAAESRVIEPASIAPDDALLYHHSIGSELTQLAAAHQGAKCLIYHNVTPHEFYAPYRPGFAWLLETGRAQLPRLACHFPVAVGDSAFNAAELARCGFARPGVLPIIVDPARWNMRADEELMRRLQDKRTNVLAVGRAAPNKRQDRVAEWFARFLQLDPGARLILAGEGRNSDPYFQHVRRAIERCELTPAQVEVTGTLSDAALLAYYRTAHLYCTFSEHEGFGVPLVEAMWCDVPVLAVRTTAVPETMGAAGVLFAPTDDLDHVATLAHRLTRRADEGDETDRAWRASVLAAQAARRQAFLPQAIAPVLAELLRRMEVPHANERPTNAT